MNAVDSVLTLRVINCLFDRSNAQIYVKVAKYHLQRCIYSSLTRLLICILLFLFCLQVSDLSLSSAIHLILSTTRKWFLFLLPI